MKREEQKIHISVAQFLDWALPSDAVWFHVGNGMKRTKAEAGILKAFGVKAGVPDIWILWRSKTYAIELKATKGEENDAQEEMLPRIEFAGAFVAICRSLPAVVSQLDDWKIPLKARIAA